MFNLFDIEVFTQIYEWKIYCFLDDFVIVIVIYYIFMTAYILWSYYVIRVWLFSVLLSAQYNNFSSSKTDLYAFFPLNS